MDHSYSTEKDCRRERERLRRQDHSYFSIADKTPVVIQRKQQLEKTEYEWIGGKTRDDHTYGRRVTLNKENACSPAKKKGNELAADKPADTDLSCSSSDEEMLLDEAPELADQQTAQSNDHNYWMKHRTRRLYKQCNRSRYDHQYCSALVEHCSEGNEAPRQRSFAIEQANTSLRDCGCPASSFLSVPSSPPPNAQQEVF